MKFSRVTAALMVSLFCVSVFGGCAKGKGSSSGSNSVADSSSDTAIGATRTIKTAYPDKEAGFQLDKPAVGEEIAVMHTSMGDISIRFFPEAAPKAVENFKTHAKQGYYNGLTFHRVINNFMIQSGDPKGDGTGGESIWGGEFNDEFDSKLLNLRGALAMANSGPNTNGSQFFINQNPASKFQGKASCLNEESSMESQCQEAYKQHASQLKSRYPTWQDYFKATYNTNFSAVPDSVWDLYSKNGGNIKLDAVYSYSGGYTVFGQAFTGLDVVDKIAAVQTNTSDKPLSPVTISSIDIINYAG